MEIEQNVSSATEKVEENGDSNPKSDGEVDTSDSTKNIINETIISDVMYSEPIKSSPILKKESHEKNDAVSTVFDSRLEKEAEKSNLSNEGIINVKFIISY